MGNLSSLKWAAEGDKQEKLSTITLITAHSALQFVRVEPALIKTADILYIGTV